jgi:hypothetical protein
MPINAVPMTVEMAFGFGPGSSPGAGAWVDITQYVDVTPSSSGVVATTGRDSGRSGISSGTLTLTLENADGRFNPRNASGPYFGQLDNGTLVRIRTTYASVTRTRWLGFIDSGWPQTITARYPTVTVTAHNVLGLLAQGDAPRSAWDAFLASWSPAPYCILRPGPDEWIDSVSGAAIPHTGRLTELEGDPLVDGGDAPWGQDDPVGYGNTTASAFGFNTGSDSLTALVRFRLPSARALDEDGNPADVTVAHTLANGYEPFTIIVKRDSVAVYADTAASGLRFALTMDVVALFDDRPHTMLVHVPQGSGDVRLWIDGRELGMTLSTTPGAITILLDGFRIGKRSVTNASSSEAASVPYQGVIDPLVMWLNHPTGTLPTLATSSHEAATKAWTELRLDQRVTNLVTAMGLSSRLGTLDTSGIVTQQGYRQAAPLELLQRIEDTEAGRIWVDREGALRFSKRSWAWDDTVSDTVQLTFSDDPALIAGGSQEMLEAGTVIADDPLNIVNVASVNSTFGREQTVENATSVARYGRRGSVSFSNLLHSSDRQSRALAEWLTLSQGTPQVQARQVSFRVEDNPTVLAPFAAQVEEGWLVRIRKTTTAETLDLYAHVIGIEHQWSWTGWTVTLTLDATRTGFTFFRWGTSTWGGSAGWAF